MKLDWLKKLFHKKQVSLSTFDTGTIFIPEFHELSEENKELVLMLSNKINMTNYHSTVKYSEDLSKRTDKYLQILFVIVKEIDDSILKLKEFDKKYQGDYISHRDELGKVAKYFGRIKLLEKEAELLRGEIAKNDIIATLKTIAFKEFVNRELKKKPKRFTELFKAEKMEKESRLRGFIEEYNRLTNAINIIRTNLYSATLASTVTDYNPLIDKMNKQVTYNYLHGKFFFDQLNDLNAMNRLFDREEIKGIELRFYQTGEGWLFKYIPSDSEKYGDLINQFAKEQFEIDKVVYDKFLEGKDLIAKIKECTSKYSGKGSWRWDKEQLKKDYNQYERMVWYYFETCKRFMNEGVKNQLRDALFDLAFYYISCNYYDIDPDIVKDNRVRERAKQMLIEIYARDINPSLSKSDLNIIDQLIYESFVPPVSNSAGLIIDIYNNDINPAQSTINGAERRWFNNYLLEKDSNRNNDYYDFAIDLSTSRYDAIYYNVFDLYKKIKHKGRASIKMEKDISFENFYHALKCSGVDDKQICANGVLKRFGSTIGLRGNIRNLLVDAQLGKVKKEYDDRIMIIPKELYIYDSAEEFYLNNNTPDKEEKLEAVFFQKAFDLIHNRYHIKRFKNIKYVFVTEEALERFKNHLQEQIRINEANDIQLYMDMINGTEDVKVIIVPNDTKYSDLSNYLDKELGGPVRRMVA